MREILLASENEGKLSELNKLIGSRPWRIYSLKDFPGVTPAPETGTTFRENARIKAESVASATGLLTLADDSGLEVDYLGGEPGVLSARFAGVHGDDQGNNAKLLRLLEGVPRDQRQSRFRCVLAIAPPMGEVFFTEGSCEGIIADEPAGTNGFGYDPLFWLPGFQRSMAELTMEEKNRISHRAKAFQAAIPILDKILG